MVQLRRFLKNNKIILYKIKIGDVYSDNAYPWILKKNHFSLITKLLAYTFGTE